MLKKLIKLFLIVIVIVTALKFKVVTNEDKSKYCIYKKNIDGLKRVVACIELPNRMKSWSLYE